MPAATRPMRASHVNGTLSAGVPTRIVPLRGGVGFRVRVTNTGDTNSMDISFDGGKTGYTINKGVEFAEDVLFGEFWLTSASGTTYQALIFEG